jgi:hypothetical protein
MKKIFWVWLVATMFVGCSTPMNKESYLKKFDAFITDVSANYKTWQDEEWAKKIEQYERFSGEWYKKFEKELTFQEEVKVVGFQTKFNYYKALDESSTILRNFKEMLNNVDTDEIRETVRSYVNSDRMDELKLLYEEAVQVGGAAMDAMTRILNELQISVEELQNESSK